MQKIFNSPVAPTHYVRSYSESIIRRDGNYSGLFEFGKALANSPEHLRSLSSRATVAVFIIKPKAKKTFTELLSEWLNKEFLCKPFEYRQPYIQLPRVSGKANALMQSKPVKQTLKGVNSTVSYKEIQEAFDRLKPKPRLKATHFVEVWKHSYEKELLYNGWISGKNCHPIHIELLESYLSITSVQKHKTIALFLIKEKL